MQPGKLETVTIGYARRWFAVTCAICAAAIVVALFLAIDSLEDFTTGFWLAVAASVAVFLILFPLPCMFTHHTAGERFLRLRMGLLMKVDIPYLAIREVSRTRVYRGFLSVGLGVRFKPKTGVVHVVSSFDKVISLKMKSELKLRAWRPPIHEMVLSVDDVDTAIDFISRKLAPEEA